MRADVILLQQQSQTLTNILQLQTGMFDLYTIIVAIFAGLALLNLLVLKLSIKDNVIISKIRHKKNRDQSEEKIITQESATKNTLKYLLCHFTPLEICAVRRAKYKLSLLLSVSIIALGTYFMPSPYYFVATGTIVYFIYFFVIMGIARTSVNEHQEQCDYKYRQKYVQVFMTVLNLSLSMAVIGVIYKSYYNSVLTAFLANFGLNVVFDNFLVRPTMSLIIGIPLSLSTSVHEYVLECEQQVVWLEQYELIGEKEMLLKPQKTMQPSKIAKNIPLRMEREVMSDEIMRNKEEDTKDKTIDILKKIKREKMLPPINMNLQSIDKEGSLNSLFNSTKKENQSNFQEKFQEKVSQIQAELPMKKKICSENMIMINPSQQEPVNNEEDMITENIETKKITQEPEHDDEYENFKKRGATFNVGESNDPLKISINNSESTSRQEPLRICLNGQINLDYQQDKSECGDEEDIDNYRKRRELMTIDDANNRNPAFGVLEIKDKNFNNGQDIEQIDINSPQRRRRQGLHVQYEIESKMQVAHRKKKKKLSHDNHRVIKFSTGEPYLEYLPNMLNKDAKTKKSQALSRKEVILDSRITNSVKRPPKRKVFGEHNENIVPEFRIEEL